MAKVVSESSAQAGRAPAWRRWQDAFVVLAAIAVLVPKSFDLEGRARGVLRVAEIAGAAKVSCNAVRRSLGGLRCMRVLWLHYQKPGSFEVRFERRVVVGLLAARRVVPRDLERLMLAYRRKREAVAPFSRPSDCRQCAVAPALSGLE